MINGKSLGRKRTHECTAQFSVRYEPGVIEAISYNAQGIESGRSLLVTAGNSHLLHMRAEQDSIRANGQDLLYLDLAIEDEEGVVHETEEAEITVTVSGAAVLQGIGSADPQPTLSYTGNLVKTYRGRAQAILRSKQEAGEILVRASAPGYQDAVLHLTAWELQENEIH